MSRRFFVENPIVGETVELAKEQAHHIANVMRFKVGDEVELFDGKGCQFRATLLDVSKKKVTLAISEKSEEDRELKCEITVAAALPKGDRQKFMIEKLVELGVRRFVPLSTTRGVSVANEKVIARIQKQVVEACKQCGRNRLMEIHSELSLAQIAERRSDFECDAGLPILLLASPTASQHISSQLDSTSAPILIGIGPEGGLEDSEVADAVNGEWVEVSLGPSILRIETAAIAAASIVGVGRHS